MKKKRLSELGPEIMNFSFFGKSNDVLRTGKMDEQSKYDSGETENCSTNLSEDYGEHSEDSTGVLDCPAE